MCDIKELKRKNEEIKKLNNAAIAVSGAVVLQVQKEVNAIELKSDETMRRLSILL